MAIVHRLLATAAAMLVACAAPAAKAAGSTRETILFVRHAEKQPEGLGQLSCKGLNRALALAGVIRARYKRIDAVFAPDPSAEKPDDENGTAYDYVRPLATVEPTAIAFGLPVQASFGYKETDKLAEALLAPAYRGATVLVGWEHHSLNTMVPKLVAGLGGDVTVLPKWQRDDFDSIWRVTIDRSGDKTVVAFALDKEGLDGRPETCPQ